MDLKLKRYWKSALILVLMIILCIPCTTKREIKNQLHIPVPGHAVKAGPAQICTALPGSRAASVSFQKVLKKDFPSCYQPYIPKADVAIDPGAFPGRNPIQESPVSLNILYQRFLI